jgi:hypothetical protein
MKQVSAFRRRCACPKSPEGLDVYGLCLRGLLLIQAFRPGENLAGLDLPNKAMAQYPEYAPAPAYAVRCHEQRIARDRHLPATMMLGTPPPVAPGCCDRQKRVVVSTGSRNKGLKSLCR